MYKKKKKKRTKKQPTMVLMVSTKVRVKLVLYNDFSKYGYVNNDDETGRTIPNSSIILLMFYD